MYHGMTVGVAIPALNEAQSIGLVVHDLLALRNEDQTPVIDEVVVCDNGSTDATAARAAQAGARVVHEEQPGYGRACQAAIRALAPSDIVLFTDADHAFHADQAVRLLEGIRTGADLVIGSRTLGKQDQGALTRSQRAGNWVATRLIRALWRHRATDLGPYRAIRSQALARLDMRDATFGWTVEMQVKAIQHGMQTVEVPVDTRQRIGQSKISGTLRGAIGAGCGILGMIARLRWQQRHGARQRVALVLLLCMACPPVAAQEPELIPMWDASDESNPATIDHGAWQEILDRYLLTDHPSGVHRFDYGALKDNAEDRQKLGAYLRSLATLDPRTFAKAEQMAYWINLYNALTVFVIVPRYPVESIKDIKSGLIDFGPWNLELIPIAGEKLTLNNIEHGILRPIWRDPRIHYAVNCASIGCPNLVPEAFRSDNLERLLEQGATEYINHPRGAQVTDGELLVSSIYDWFKVDFGGTDAGVFDHLTRYARPELATALADHDSFDDDYDWSLNGP